MITVENKKLVSLIVPCYNEERALPCFYEETCKVIDAISRYDFELFFINDGSKDKTLSVMELQELWQGKCHACRVRLRARRCCHHYGC